MQGTVNCRDVLQKVAASTNKCYNYVLQQVKNKQEKNPTTTTKLINFYVNQKACEHIKYMSDFVVLECYLWPFDLTVYMMNWYLISS